MSVKVRLAAPRNKSSIYLRWNTTPFDLTAIKPYRYAHAWMYHVRLVRGSLYQCVHGQV